MNLTIPFASMVYIVVNIRNLGIHGGAFRMELRVLCCQVDTPFALAGRLASSSLNYETDKYNIYMYRICNFLQLNLLSRGSASA
jgi:hypothetical protein